MFITNIFIIIISNYTFLFVYNMDVSKTKRNYGNMSIKGFRISGTECEDILNKKGVFGLADLTQKQPQPMTHLELQHNRRNWMGGHPILEKDQLAAQMSAVKDKSTKIKKYILKDAVDDTKTYKLKLVLLKKIKGVNARSETELYFKIIGKYPKFILDYNFGDSLLIANKNSISFDKRMYIGDVDYILEEDTTSKTSKTSKKICPNGKILNLITNRCKKPLVKDKQNNLSRYTSLMEWRKTSPLGKKFNKMILKVNIGGEWDYKLAESYNLEEKRMEKKFDKPVKIKKLVKSEALKIHNKIYKIWDKLAKKSMKLYGYKEYFVPNPQFHNISKPKSFKHKIKTINNDGFSLECDCGYTTGDKYLIYENCMYKSIQLPSKPLCDKFITLLKKDLNNIEKLSKKIFK